MRYMKMIGWIVACMGAISFHADAETPIDISVNGTYIQLDAAAVIEDGRTLVPIRAVGEALCFDNVVWEPDLAQVQIQSDDTNILLEIGKNTAKINGETVWLDAAPRLYHNRTYVPLRFVSEAMGASVMWNETKHTVEITKDGLQVPPAAVQTGYTEHDLDWLAKIIHAEAQGESHAGKVAVGNVVLNRVESDQFPDTIYDVIFDRKYGVQFTPIANGAIYNSPAKESYSAAKQAMHGRDEAGKSLYFCNPNTSTSSWIMNNRKLYRRIGKHDFFL